MEPGNRTRTKPVYRFGPFRLVPAERTLLRDTEPVALTPKAFDLLLLLVESAGHLKTRRELIQALWPTTVVEEANLSWNVRAVRKALGDEGAAPHYIKTVHRHGYRFIAPVQTEGLGNTVAAVTGFGRGHRAWIAASATLVIVVTALLVFLVWPRPFAARRTAPAPRSRPGIAVLGFQNLSHDRTVDWIGTALTEMVNTDLAAGGQLRTTPAMDVTRVRREFNLPAGGGLLNRELLGAVQNNLGVRYVASGAYLLLGSGDTAQLRVDVKLIDTSSGTTVAALSETGSRDELFDLVRSIGVGLRDRLGVAALGPIEEGAVRASIPTSLTAARAYADGLRTLAAGNPVAAHISLERAIAIEPDFALAYVSLAQTWLALGDEVNARAAAKKALDNSAGLARRQRLLIDGLYREAGHEWDQAVEDYRALFTFYPDDLQYGLLLARAQRSAGQLRDALATVAILRRLPSPAGSDPRMDLSESHIYDDMADDRRAAAAAARAVATAQARGATLLQAQALSQLGQSENHVGNYVNALDSLGEARRLYEKVGGDPLGLGITQVWIGNVYVNQGDYADAIRSFDEANVTFSKIGNRYWQGTALKWIGNVHYYRNQFDQAQQYYELALPIFRDVHRDLAVGQVFTDLGIVRGERGDQAGAIRYYQEAIANFLAIGAEAQSAAPLFDLGNTYVFIGEFSNGRRSFEDAKEIYKMNKDEPDEAAVTMALADIEVQQDHLSAARQGYERALAILKTKGKHGDTADAESDLAELASLTGDQAQAIIFARGAVQEYRREKASSDEAYARGVLGLALLAEGRRSDAQLQLKAIEALYPAMNKGDSRLYVDIFVARLNAAFGDAEAATKSLRNVIAQAESGTTLQYRARLALALVQAKQGPTPQGETMTRQLVADARKAGYALVARQAEALLASARKSRSPTAPVGGSGRRLRRYQFLGMRPTGVSSAWRP